MINVAIVGPGGIGPDYAGCRQKNLKGRPVAVFDMIREKLI